MSKFDTYFLMTTEDAIEYAKLKVPQMEWDAESMECKEIGDGNLNYVFKVTDGRGHSVIIKQAGGVARISEDMKLDTDRNRIESEILVLQGKLAPGYVPEIYFYDTVMSACGMQDRVITKLCVQQCWSIKFFRNLQIRFLLLWLRF